MQSQLLNCIVRIFVGIFILVNGRALTVLLGSSSSLLHGTYSIFYRKDSIQYIYYMSAALMRIPSKRPAIIINTIQFAWHNNNFIMQNMYLKKPNLNHMRKSKSSYIQSYYIFFKLPLSWKHSATNISSGIKYSLETSKIAPGCLERTLLFKLRRNTQISEFRIFSIFVILRI